jgi:hypothetical protein
MTANPAAEQQDFLKDCADFTSSGRLADYALFEQYYDGEQNVKLTDRTKRFLEQHGSQVKWCENFSEVIVDVLAERLVVSGFGIYSEDEGDTSAAEDAQANLSAELHSYVDDLLEQNIFDSMQDVAHTTGLIKGDAFLVAYVDEGKPCLTWNPPETFKVYYSTEKPDEMKLAVKKWNTKKEGPSNPEGAAITRMNLYYEDRIEKYFCASDDGDFEKWTEPQDEGKEQEPWPAPWVDSDEQPLGIPVFHLKYKSLGRPMGRSRLKAAIPFQDELNKQVVDLMMVMDHLGWPQRYVFGVDLDQGQVDSLIGDYLTGGNTEIKVGQFDAANPQGILDSIDATLARLSRRCRVPLYQITGGTMPSGESLKAAESGIVRTALLTQTEWGSVWENAVRMLIRLGQTFADAPPADLDTLTIRCEWDDAESRNDLEEANTALIYDQLGVSKDTNLTRLGFDPEEERDKKAQELAESKQTQDMFFNAGNADGAASEEPTMPMDGQVMAGTAV